MPRTLVDIPSIDPARLLRRLCNHWRHKFEIDRRDDRHALIPLGEVGTAEFTMPPGVLHVEAWHDDAGQLPRLRQVIEKHLQRFAGNETLVFDWRDGD